MKKSILYKFLLSITFLTLFSCNEILFEKDISNKEMVLIAPSDEAQFYSTGVTFSWENVENVNEYRLQIAKPNFANPMQIVLDTVVSTNTFSYQFNIGEYEWRIKGVNSAYETPYKSRFFTIVSDEDFQNNSVVLNTPSNNLITNSAAQNLSWQSIIGTSSYQVQVYDGSSTVISDQTITATSLNYTFPQGNYNWRVRASNGTEQTLYSSRSILVDTTVPNTPVLSSPANASTTTDNDVSFQWSRTPIVGSVEKDSIYIYTNSALTSLQLKNQVSSPFTTNLNVGTYYWFLKSFDEAGNISNSSSVFSFTIN